MLRWFGDITSWLAQHANFFFGLIVLLVSLLVARLGRGPLRRQLQRSHVDLQVVVLATRVLTIGIILLGVILTFSIWSGSPTVVFGGFGVFALAFSLAFQDILKNFIAGLFLLLERPFRIGDEIVADNHVGVVENVEMRTTTLRTAEGEEVLIPNALVYTSTIVNRTRFPSRQFTVTTKVPDAVALDGLGDRVRDRVKGLKEILTDPPPVTVLVPGPDGNVTMEVRYWVDYRQHDPVSVRNAVSQQVYQELQGQAAARPANPS